ncbi:MAG: sensor histidine kinase [Angustibacter sp.]
MTGGLALRRTTYLLAGGGIALGFLMLTAAVLSMFVTDGALLASLLVLAVVPIAAVGALPGIRDLQVAGARTLLGVEGTVVPEPMRWPHRWRTCLWTLLHQVVGFLTGLAMLSAAGAAAVAGLLAWGNRTAVWDGLIERPDSVGAWLLLGAAALGVGAVTIGFIWLAGAVASWAAPVLLGPIGPDRLALAEARLEHEQHYLRLSRDLHDGVGHALSAISLQAEAGRRHLATDANRTAAALSAIGDLAGSAVAELDHALGVLRDGNDVRQPEPGLSELATLLERHRSLGTVVLIEPPQHLDEPGCLGDLPAIVSRTAYRVCSEGLANAAKHGTGPVTLTLDRDDRQLEVTLRNNISRDGTPHGLVMGGHGLDGVRERVALLGGHMSAGPAEVGWVLEARLPLDGDVVGQDD